MKKSAKHTQDTDEPLKSSKKQKTDTGNSSKFNSGSKKMSNVISLDSDDDEDFDMKDDGDEDDDEFNDDDIFGDEDDDAFLDDIEEIKPPHTSRVSPRKAAVEVKQSPKRSPKKSPQKAKKEPIVEPIVETVEQTSPAKKKSAPKPKTEIPDSAPISSGMTAEQVLSTIPDADLPEDVEDKKFNFFAKKAADASTGTGELVQIPEAQPNCLSGLTIVFTGVLPRLDRDTSENLAKRYGAKVTKSISGKTSLVVIGDEAGPSKIKKIKLLHIKAINEDGFIQLLQSMPMEGGDGAAAQKAKLKREEEERKIVEEAEEEERRAQEEEARQKRLLEARKAASIEKASHSQSSHREPAEVPRIIPDSEKLWTVKYAPSRIDQLCGNKGQVQKLQNWLSNWFDNAKKDFKVPGRDGSGIYRACLISGPPGIGKTSAAHLVAKSLGFDILEKNASDVRSKSLLNSNLKSVLTNTSVVGFFKHRDENIQHTQNDRRFCLIMDEVDGMSSGDHGGAGALSAFCKITHMPMILICNDKSLPKMRTFDRVTLDLPFRRPSEAEMKSRLMSIALREKIKLDPTVIGQLVQATGNDIRQIINLLSTVSKTQSSIGGEQAKDAANSWKKQTVLKPFDITARLLNAQIYSPNAKHSLNDKIDLYFNDIDFAPLMIQENYLLTRPSDARTPQDHLRRVANAADDISESDRINSLIRSSEQQWSLLPFHGVMSSVKPSSQVAGQISQRINFAGWLGQNSKAMKYQRMLQDLQYHTRLRTSTDKKELRLDYLPTLRQRLTEPLLQGEEQGIQPVIDIMDYYYLTKEDWDNIVDLGVGRYKGELVLKGISTKTKSAFTRSYNSTTHPIAIYKTGNSVGAMVSSKKNVDYEDVIEDDTNTPDKDDEEVDPDKIDSKKDKLIKEVKPKKTARKAKAAPKGRKK